MVAHLLALWAVCDGYLGEAQTVDVLWAKAGYGDVDPCGNYYAVVEGEFA